MLLDYNVHDFLTTGQINICVADIVYQEKRRVVMFQDVFDTQKYGRKNIRMLVVATPVFNSEGNVQNIISVVRPLATLEKLQNEASMSEPVSQLTPTNSNEIGGDSIIASSASMREVLTLAVTVAMVDSAVLITGESGTGKEVVAQYIHQKSERSDKQMVIINCASLPVNLLEAELFGYEKGAFTGAAPGGKKGLFEEAHKSTLFLDEINSISYDLQGKLLRAIETKTIQRIGSTKTIDVDFRLLAATNEDLEVLVEEKKFRADLYYRLNVIPIDVPPLRERREDIIPMANHFLYHFCKRHNKQKIFTQHTLTNMRQYSWPGNVRQLKNFVERSVVISIGEEIEIGNVESVVGGKKVAAASAAAPGGAHYGYAQPGEGKFAQMQEEGISLQEYLDRCEREYLDWALQKYTNTYKAAEVLGTSQSAIMRRKKKHSL